MAKQTIKRDLFDQVMVPNYSPMEVIPVRGEGSKIWDQQGNQYIDFAGGIAVSSLGHCHPKLVSVLKEQGEKIWHLSNVMTNEPALRLAKKLCQKTFAERVFLCNSGGEANEAAFKLARRYAFDHYGDHKHEIISFRQSFHGRTLFTVSVGGQPKYTEGFGPAIEGLTHLPFNDLKTLEQAISGRTCAVVMEPVQGEGGIIPATSAFAKGVRKLCDKYNALLIYDEVQSGAGRTGDLYAYMGMGVTPDILTTAKGIGGGFPFGAMLTTENISNSFVVGTHGSTYGGNPLGCSIAEAVLDTISSKKVLDGVKSKHNRIIKGLKKINSKEKVFESFRGKGLLIGCVLNKKMQGKSREVLNAALAQQLLVLVAGPNVMRLAPSLIIPNQDIDEGLGKFELALKDLNS